MKATVTIKKNSEFRRIYNKGANAATSLLVLYARKGRPGQTGRLGITVGTKVGKAVVRNTVRRRLREIYRLNRHRLRPGYDVIIVARVRSRTVGYGDLERDFLRLADRLGLLVKDEKDTDISGQGVS
ncbi:MAG: ribonuclease P protein component [Oscillospiraceae bacterium]|nr:ribonuclease P protein component [Oscillospiraceae bacterium]